MFGAGFYGPIEIGIDVDPVIAEIRIIVSVIDNLNPIRLTVDLKDGFRLSSAVVPYVSTAILLLVDKNPDFKLAQPLIAMKELLAGQLE